jgi:hypothetical protein
MVDFSAMLPSMDQVNNQMNNQMNNQVNIPMNNPVNNMKQTKKAWDIGALYEDTRGNRQLVYLEKNAFIDINSRKLVYIQPELLEFVNLVGNNKETARIILQSPLFEYKIGQKQTGSSNIWKIDDKGTAIKGSLEDPESFSRTDFFGSKVSAKYVKLGRIDEEGRRFIMKKFSTSANTRKGGRKNRKTRTTRKNRKSIRNKKRSGKKTKTYKK